MGALIWAISTFSLVMLIVYFLPLGFTKKGKFIAVITGFLLAMAGMEAASTFSLMMTFFILIVLVFFVAYLLDSRAGTLLYIHDEMDKEQYIDEDSPEPVMNNRTDIKENMETEISSVSTNLLTENMNVFQEVQNTESEIPVIATDDDDISFLLNRRLTIEEEQEKKTEEPTNANDYLAEIEELLDAVPNEEPVGKKQIDTKVKTPALDIELEEIPVLSFHEKEDES